MNLESFLRDVLYGLGQGSSGGARIWDGVAGGLMAGLGFWLGYELWCRPFRRQAEPSPVSGRDKTSGNGDAARGGSKPEESPAGMRKTAPVYVRVDPGQIPGMERTGPKVIRPPDLAGKSLAQLVALAAAAKRDLEFFDKTARTARAKAGELEQDAARLSGLLRQARETRDAAVNETETAGVGMGDGDPASQTAWTAGEERRRILQHKRAAAVAEARRLEWMAGEAQDRVNAARDKAREAGEAAAMARIVAEVAEAAVRNPPG